MDTSNWQKCLEFFHRCQKLLFPIKKSEIKVFTPLFLLYFCLSFIYNGLRPLKVSLVMTASPAGAEVIPFLKVWGIIPGALLFTWLFAFLSRKVNREQTFYILISIFLSYYFLFGTYLLPASQEVSLTVLADYLREHLPGGFRGFISMLEYWHLSLFYVLCEIWSSCVMFVLFWGFVNEVTPMESAGRFYPLYNLGGNLASTFVGLMVTNFSKNSQGSEANFAYSIIILIFGCGIFAIALYRYVTRILKSRQSDELTIGQAKARKKSKEGKVSFTLGECFSHLLKSRYLLYLLVLVIAYNLVFNLIDVMWSQKVKDFYGRDWVRMTGFMGQVTTMKGVISSVLVFVSHIIIRKFGWKKATLITPLSILVTSFVFFPLVSFGDSPLLEGLVTELFSTSVLWIAVLTGSVQNSLTRGTKYSIYDSVKEMAFIPLSTDLKRKGKAVIDGVASRLGKSSGSIFYMILLPICGSLQATIPYISVIAIVVTLFWVYSIVSLDTLMKQEIAKQPDAKEQDHTS